MKMHFQQKNTKIPTKTKRLLKIPRRPRLDIVGFHHIVNRGVVKSKVYKYNEDKEKYLGVLISLLHFL